MKNLLFAFCRIRVGITLSILPLFFIVIGCRGGSVLPTATGTPYEVLVVMNDQQWKGEAGRALFDVLDGDMSGLPQSEANFRISAVTPLQFDNILKPVRNIVIVDISDQNTTPRFSKSKNMWADQQSILYIKAPNEQEMKDFVNKNKQVIIDYLVSGEMNRAVKLLEKSQNKEAKELLTDHLGLSINVPSEMKLTNTGKNFFWASNGQYKGRMDLIVYTLPYYSEDQLSKEALLAARDSILKINIPGGRPNTYMTTQKLFDADFRTMNINNKYAAEMRGLWEMHGDMMGGPFVSHTRIDEPNGRIVVAEVFVYAPEKEKRNLLRRLEATLYTLILPQETNLPEVVIEMPTEQK